MVFLVFDTIFSPYNLMAKAKAIAEKVIAQSDKSAQYVLLSIEPMQGLRYILGPTRDLKAHRPRHEKVHLRQEARIHDVEPHGRELDQKPLPRRDVLLDRRGAFRKESARDLRQHN